MHAYVGISCAKAKEDEKVEKAKEGSNAIHHSAFEGMWAGQAASAGCLCSRVRIA